jgi:hypothetical protein
MLASLRHYKCKPDIGKLMRIYHKGGNEEVHTQLFISRPGFGTSVCYVCGHTGQRRKMERDLPSVDPMNALP